MTAVSVSTLKAHETSSSPLVIQRSTVMLSVSCSNPMRQKTIQERMHETMSRLVVISSEARTPRSLPKKPAISAPKAGRNTIAA